MTITHIVHFRYTASATEDDRRSAAERFQALFKKSVGTDGSPLMLSFDGGSNNSPEGFDKGLEASSFRTASLFSRIDSHSSTHLL